MCEAVVSKLIATIFSAQPQSLRAASTARASIRLAEGYLVDVTSAVVDQSSGNVRQGQAV